MFDAVSMYLGGAVVAASDCDYNSAKQLGLTCPFCKSAVFFKGEQVREQKGKLKYINSHFSHYKTGTPEDLDCEKRSHTKQGKEEIIRMRGEAKNQRLKLYNKHLWQMFMNDRNFTPKLLNNVTSLIGKDGLLLKVISIRTAFKNNLSSIYTYIDESVNVMSAENLGEKIESSYSIKPDYLSTVSWQEEISVQKAYIAGCDSNLHRAICYEIADFLATRSGGYALEKIFYASLIPLERLWARDGNYSMMLKVPAENILPAIAGVIAGTHWITQINKERASNILQKINP
jgi:hypothetical protein